MSSRVPLLLARALALAVLGAVVGACCVAVHGLWWGLPLGLGATLALLLAVPPGWSLRFALVVGWVAPLALLTPERPEGDYLIASDLRGYVLLISGAVVLAFGVSGLRPPRRDGGAPVPPTGTGDVGTAP